jgi:hypothetical protein
MDKKLLTEIHRNKELMGLNEQGVIDAAKSGIESGLNGTDEEFKLMGMIQHFLSNEDFIDVVNNDFDVNAEWITKYRRPIGEFGKQLFEYLSDNSKKYDEQKFKSFNNLFSQEDTYVEGTKPSDDEFIKMGKSIKDFQYGN